MLYEWLKDYQKLTEDIDYLEFNLDASERELKRWVSGDLKDIKLQHDSLGAQVEENIEKIRSELSIKKRQRTKLIELVETFKGLDQKILRMKWIEHKTLEHISIDLGYSYNYIKRKHAELMKIIRFADALK